MKSAKEIAHMSHQDNREKQGTRHGAIRRCFYGAVGLLAASCFAAIGVAAALQANAAAAETKDTLVIPLKKCEAYYHDEFLTPAESKRLFRAISKACDLDDFVVEMADGRKEKRDIGMFVFADQSLVEASWAGAFGRRQIWIKEVRDLKEKVEAVAKHKYDVCVGYYYKDGNSGFDYHWDVPMFTNPASQSCVSIGQERSFSFRHVDDHDDTYSWKVSDGSLLIMGKHCRKRYEHALPTDPSAKHPRIVLVFQDYGRWIGKTK
jgi:alkylated DNA repair dioxygenase AlkB